MRKDFHKIPSDVMNKSVFRIKRYLYITTPFMLLNQKSVNNPHCDRLWTVKISALFVQEYLWKIKTILLFKIKPINSFPWFVYHVKVVLGTCRLNLKSCALSFERFRFRTRSLNSHSINLCCLLSISELLNKSSFSLPFN